MAREKLPELNDKQTKVLHKLYFKQTYTSDNLAYTEEMKELHANFIKQFPETQATERDLLLLLQRHRKAGELKARGR